MQIARRLLIVAAVIGVTLLGNLRSQASEIGQGPTAEQRAPFVPYPVPVRVDLALAQAVTTDAEDADADADASDEELRLVPAIYAWDPDVRFVYFRHVSKWM
jgi:hypothetical protein